MEKKSFDKWKQKNRSVWYWLQIPTSWIEYIKPKELDWLATAHGNWRKVYFKDRSDMSDGDWSRRWESANKRRTYRKILRARRNDSFGPGMYTVRTGQTYLEPVVGKFNCPDHNNLRWADRPKKGAVLLWVEKDILGRQIFMFQDKMYAATGAYLDGISPI